MSKDKGLSLIGSDIKLAEFFLGADIQVTRAGDIEIAFEELNLAQAILHRLRTAKGELAELGHPEYGSTILDFVGQPNNWMTRERLKLAIRDSIRQERRIKEIVSISVNPRIGVKAHIEQDAKGAARKERIAITVSASSKASKAEPVGGSEREGKAVVEEDIEMQDLSNRTISSNAADLLNSVDVEILILPIGSEKPVQIAFPFNLEGA